MEGSNGISSLSRKEPTSCSEPKLMKIVVEMCADLLMGSLVLTMGNIQQEQAGGLQTWVGTEAQMPDPRRVWRMELPAPPLGREGQGRARGTAASALSWQPGGLRVSHVCRPRTSSGFSLLSYSRCPRGAQAALSRQRSCLPAEVDTPVLTTPGLWGTFFFTPYAARKKPLSEQASVGGWLLEAQK